jgi:hypothetical protein
MHDEIEILSIDFHISKDCALAVASLKGYRIEREGKMKGNDRISLGV